jgi:hypothetical protein
MLRSLNDSKASKSGFSAINFATSGQPCNGWSRSPSGSFLASHDVRPHALQQEATAVSLELDWEVGVQLGSLSWVLGIVSPGLEIAILFRESAVDIGKPMEDDCAMKLDRCRNKSF